MSRTSVLAKTTGSHSTTDTMQIGVSEIDKPAPFNRVCKWCVSVDIYQGQGSALDKNTNRVKTVLTIIKLAINCRNSLR